MIDILGQIIRQSQEAKGLYNRLVLVVAPSGSGKTALMQETAQSLQAPLINVNLSLSLRMLELSQKERIIQLSSLLDEILQDTESEIVLLDNLEILFDTSLKQDPLRLLLNLSRRKTIVATWNCSIENDSLTYATPDHPEFRKYPIKDFLVVNAEANFPGPRMECSDEIQ